MLLVSGCVVQPVMPETDDRSILSEERLSNLEYQFDIFGSGPIQLTDGRYEDEPNRVAIYWIDTYVLGELDGEPAAAVILESSGGGSGIFKTLHLVVAREGALVNVANTMIGDRVDINAINLVDDAIILDIVAPGPEEPLCCGTERSVVHYALQGDQIVESSREVIGAQPSISETEVITFTPQTTPVESQTGNCFANAISLNRADAWRCITQENQIYDPCFQVDDAPTLICGADPLGDREGFILELTESLPAVEVADEERPWLVELGDGTICTMMTGTVPGVADQVAPYACADLAQSFLMAGFDRGFPVWFAQSVTFDLGENGFSLRSSLLKPVAKVWQ